MKRHDDYSLRGTGVPRRMRFRCPCWRGAGVRCRWGPLRCFNCHEQTAGRWNPFIEHQWSGLNCTWKYKTQNTHKQKWNKSVLLMIDGWVWAWKRKSQHWFKKWRGTSMTPSHFLDQEWLQVMRGMKVKWAWNMNMAWKHEIWASYWKSALIQEMACHQFGAKPFPESRLTQKCV